VSAPLLCIRDLRVGFATEGGLLQAVDGVSFDLAAGEVLAIVGESGSGKSVTAQTILGLTRSPNARIEGSVRLGEAELLDAGEARLREVRGERIGMVFQDPMTSFNPVYRIGAQIVEAIRAHRGDVSKADAKARAVELLESVGIPDAVRRVDDYPHQFSGGMRQRAMIAMALALEPEVLIADEPTTALDVTIQAQILRLLEDLNRERDLATILITHDLGGGLRPPPPRPGTGDVRGTGGRGGDPRRDLLRPSASLYLGPAWLPDQTGSTAAGTATADRRGAALAAGAAGGMLVPASLPARVRPLRRDADARGTPPRSDRPLRSLLARSRAEASEASGRRTDRPGSTGMNGGEPLLEVTDLVKHFPVKRGILIDREVDQVRAVDGISFAIPRGQTLGLVGESGSGKSTACRAVLQLTAPTSGSVRFEGEEIAGLSRRRMRPLRREMQMIFQDPYASLNPRKRIGQIVGDPLRRQKVASGKELQKRVRELLERVGLGAEHYDRYPHEFSGGQRQRIGIARALALQPKLVIADEPVSALDVSIRAQIVNLLDDLQDEFGLTYLFVAHDIGVVRHISDRIAVMHNGKIVEEGTADQVCEHPEDAYTKKLLAAVPIPDPRESRARRASSSAA
jgi:peptide/nickel transport system ATP-binding protein